MKQEINIGNVVDDGQGDYLRRGGQKINSNFAELYDNLGDGSRPHAAGAWKTWTTAQGPLSPTFGQSYAINTTAGRVTVNLPKGKISDYNSVIKLRDVWRTWQQNEVEIQPATGDTIKGSPNSKILNRDFMDVELVYCAPGRWEYVENKRVDKITTSDLSTVAKREYIATQGQTDFVDIFGINLYNISNTEVYLRGNLLYYGNGLSDDSNYGSVIPGTGVGPLDGSTIRLRIPCNAGDTVTVITYMDGIASFRSSYNNYSIQAFQTGTTDLVSIPGQSFVGDLTAKKEYTVVEFGVPKLERVNPNSVEVYINGKMQMRGGIGELPTFSCEGAVGDTEQVCIANGGQWVPSGQDYSLVFGTDDHVRAIRINDPLESGDFITLKWFNNDIGTVMDWEGTDGIKEHTDKVYLNNEQQVNLTGKIEYTDFANPDLNNSRPIVEPFTGRLEGIQEFFDVVYPVGTIYKNANNPNNPATYMGMGIWQRWAEGMFIAGWNSDAADTQFSLNNNSLDNLGNPVHAAGGTYGNKSVELTPDNIPELVSKKRVLVKDENGPIIIGGCQLDPDATGPGYTKYREDTLKVNDGVTSPANISIIPPMITAYVWIRVG